MAPDAGTDPTVNSPAENHLSGASDPAYAEPEYAATGPRDPLAVDPGSGTEKLGSPEPDTAPTPETAVAAIPSAPATVTTKAIQPKTPAAKAPTPIPLPVPVAPIPPSAKKPALPKSFRADPGLAEATVVGCRSSAETCRILADLLTTLELPVSFRSGCADDKCVADRILGALVPMLDAARRAKARVAEVLATLRRPVVASPIPVPAPVPAPVAPKAGAGVAGLPKAPVPAPVPVLVLAAVPAIAAPANPVANALLLAKPPYEVVGILPAWITAENTATQPITVTLKNTGIETWTKANVSLVPDPGWIAGKNTGRHNRGLMAADDIPNLTLGSPEYRMDEVSVKTGEIAHFSLIANASQPARAQLKLALNGVAGTNIWGVWLAAVKEER
ncbi:MAG: hypothetical protein Q8K99_01345, partial [Actinomycetota bacterium]|nr:hypothetical protein [Actinomycetota bacterium]